MPASLLKLATEALRVVKRLDALAAGDEARALAGLRAADIPEGPPQADTFRR